MKNKRGWLRILEATMAIMLVSGVLLVMNSRGVNKVDISERVYSLQREVLMDIALETMLRQYVLDDNQGALNEFADIKIPSAFSFRVRLCPLGDPCKLNVTDVRDTRGKDVYVQDIVIAGEYDEYDPKKVRLFVWEQPRDVSFGDGGTPDDGGETTPDPRDEFLVIDGFDSGEWDLFGTASISGGVLSMTDTGGDISMNTDSHAVYKQVEGSDLDSNLFFVIHFNFTRLNVGDGNAITFMTLIDAGQRSIKQSKQLLIKDGQTVRDTFAIRTTEVSPDYQLTVVPANVGQEYGLRFTVDSSLGDVTFNIDSDLDGFYDNGGTTDWEINSLTQQGITPRFDAFGGGSSIEISSLRVYVYPNAGTYNSLNP